MKKLRKHVKKALCMALSAAMLFTSIDMTVLAEESVQAEEKQQEFQSEEISMDNVPVEEEITEEAPVREETTEQASEELDSESKDGENALTDKVSEEKDTEKDVENASTEDILTEETVSETDSDEADTEETDTAENELKEPNIASGEYKEYGNDISWKIDEDGKLTVTGTGEFSASLGEERTPWYSYRESITSAEVRVKGMKIASYMFYGCSNLTNVDVSGFDTSSVIHMWGMFYGCSSLTSLDLSGWNTSHVIDMGSMFNGCSGLTSLDLSGWNTNSVRSMDHMFADCSSLTSLDVSGFDTSSVTHMAWMFSGCSSLTSLDVSRWDTSSVIHMYSIFYDCSGLTSLDVSRWNTGSVTEMWRMFQGCSSLTSLDLSGLDTSSVTDMSGLFTNCSSLTSLDLSGFDTSSVTNMSGLFTSCSSLTSVDLSGFDTSSVTNMSHLFIDCSSLTSVDLSGFNTSQVTDMSLMFYGCSGLTSLDLSGFDMSCVTDMLWMFVGCSSFTTLYTPCNVQMNSYCYLRTAEQYDVWYDSVGTTYTYLPEGLDYSIILMKDTKPEVSAERIRAIKEKTSYYVGDTINTDDLTVRYYSSDGTVKILNAEDYTVSEVDTSTAGKTLIVTYKDLTAEIKLTILKKEEGSSTESSSTESSSTESSATEESSSIEESSITEEINTNDQRPRITESGVLFPKKADSYSTVYTGEKICPTMIVTYAYQDNNGKPKTQTLKLNVDYTVTYKNNINVGETATVTVKGIGEYQGTVTKYFTITPKSISKVTLSAVGDIKYEDIKNGKTPKVTVMDGTKELVQDTDYTLSWTEGNANTTTVSTLTVKAVDSKSCNYTGEASKKATFNILGSDAESALSITDASIEWKNPSKTYTYNGKAQKPAVVVKDKDGNKVSSSYYKVIYTNNVNAGTNTAEV